MPVDFSLSASAHAKLAEFTQGRGTSMFMIVHAALAVLLGRLSGSGDVVIGTPVAGRGAAELDDLVGMFVNTLPLRTSIDFGLAFSDVVSDIRITDLDAFDNADIPFEDIADAVVSVRSQARHPVFQVALSFQNLEPVRLDLPKLSVMALDAGELEAKFDLQFTIEERTDGSGLPAGLYGSLLYATDLFDEATATSYTDRLVRILEAVSSNADAIVGDIDIMSEDERERTETQAAPEPSIPASPTDRTLAQIIGSVVELDPDAPAIAHDGEELSFLEFEGRSARLARVLIDAGVGPGDNVVITLSVSLEWAVGVWAVLLSGAAVVVGDRNRGHAVLANASSADYMLGNSDSEVPAGVSLVALDDPATVDAIAAASSRPIAYSARTRLLGAKDAAVLVVQDDAVTAMTHNDVVASQTRLNERLEVTYESRLFASQATDEIWHVSALIASAIAGAVWTMPSSAPHSELAHQLADEWVTHAILTVREAESIDAGELEDLEFVLLIGADATVPTYSGQVSVVSGVRPFDGN